MRLRAETAVTVQRTADNQPLGLRVNGQPALILGTTGSLGMGTCTNVGVYSAALGYQTTARGSYSLAMGNNSVVNGDASTAIGWRTYAAGYAPANKGVNP